MKKGILIDVKNETVTEVVVTKTETGSQLKSIYEHVGCNLVEIVGFDEKNDVYVDEEGLLTMDNNSKFFQMEGYPQPICGNGLIMGFDDETGESIDTTLSIDEVKEKVKFMTLSEVRMSVM